MIKLKTILAMVGILCISAKVGKSYFADYITNIISQKSKYLSGPIELITTFSSFGGIVSFFVDLMDKKGDGYLRIKYA